MIAGGIVAGALFLLSMALFIGATAPQMPPMSASAAEKAAFYAEQARSPVYSLVRMLIFLQLAPITLFLGGLYGRLGRIEGGELQILKRRNLREIDLKGCGADIGLRCAGAAVGIAAAKDHHAEHVGAAADHGG